MAILKEKEIYKAAHKAATTLYVLERSKEGGGMTVRQVEEIVKKKFHGIGPSKSTIQHYVVNLNIKGESPKKEGLSVTFPRSPINRYVSHLLACYLSTRI